MVSLEGEDWVANIIIGGVVAGLLFGVFESQGWILSDVAKDKGKLIKRYTKKGRQEAHRKQMRELCRPEMGILEGCMEL